MADVEQIQEQPSSRLLKHITVGFTGVSVVSLLLADILSRMPESHYWGASFLRLGGVMILVLTAGLSALWWLLRLTPLLRPYSDTDGKSSSTALLVWLGAAVVLGVAAGAYVRNVPMVTLVMWGLIVAFAVIYATISNERVSAGIGVASIHMLLLCVVSSVLGGTGFGVALALWALVMPTMIWLICAATSAKLFRTRRTRPGYILFPLVVVAALLAMFGLQGLTRQRLYQFQSGESVRTAEQQHHRQQQVDTLSTTTEE